MSLITDQHDISGSGMFSKAGRFTTKKYIIFLKRDEILYNKRKTINIKEFNNKEKQKKQEEELDEFNLEELKKQNEEQIKKQQLEQQQKVNQKQKIQPFAKIQSREQIQEVQRVKNKAPPVGYYHPKYQQIDKNILFCQNLREYSKNRFKTAQGFYKPNISLEEEIQRPAITQRLKDRIIGPLTLDVQKGRDNIFINKQNNPHEKRFFPVQFNQTWSNCERVHGFDLQKQIGREDGKIYNNKEHAPDYDPNFEVGKRKIATSIPQFKRDINRKPFHKESLTKNENYFDYDYYAKEKNQQSQLFSRIKSPNIKEQLPREYNNKSKNTQEINSVLKNLPTFMQKNISNRIGITHLTQKMLETNCYVQGRFQTIHTAFNKTHPKKKEDQFDLDESFQDIKL